ncbi:hypothetical protein F4780DRAFT_782517 [Xylariomycetidae sp. FL0641]|nr:hypothetical protein F4780DRAFT_782517 [Xylariomycetidae sp. FL0641]
MSPRYDEAPELAQPDYPEVHHLTPRPEVAQPYYGYYPKPPVSPGGSTNDQTTLNAQYASPSTGYPASQNPFQEKQTVTGSALPVTAHPKAAKRICGCTVIVLVLSTIVALLSGAVIGLAAGTGIEASRANDAEAKLASMSASRPTVTVTASSATSTSGIDNGCSEDGDGVSGTTYTTKYNERSTFTIYCNSDTPIAPLLSLFVGNFDDCMDACAFYSHYIPEDFASKATAANATCDAVSFIPAWTNRTFALDGYAPGNCYLKPGPQNTTALTNPNVGTPVHAAILSTA